MEPVSLLRLSASFLAPVPTAPTAVGTSVPEKTDDVVRLLTLNLAHGRGPRQTHVRRGRLENNLARVADAVCNIGPDIVALQEADGPSAWSGNFDHVARLAQDTQLENHFRGDHNPFDNDRFSLQTGTALLANGQLEDPVSVSFSENWRDTKGFVAASIPIAAWGGQHLRVASVHLDFLAPNVRRRQIQHMSDVLGDREGPLVVLGDLNCCFEKESHSMELLTEALGLRAFQPEAPSPTYPAFNPKRRLDWILISDDLDFGGYGTLHTLASDHLMVTADLVRTK